MAASISNDHEYAIVGEYAADALLLIDLQYLTKYQPQSQDEFVDVIQKRSLWLRMARLVGINEGSVTQRLQALQIYVANSPPDARCPCGNGHEFVKWQDHWPGCPDAKELQELEEREQASKARDKQLRIAHQQQAAQILENWGPYSIREISRKTLVRMRRDLDNFLRNDGIWMVFSNSLCSYLVSLKIYLQDPYT